MIVLVRARVDRWKEARRYARALRTYRETRAAMEAAIRRPPC